MATPGKPTGQTAGRGPHGEQRLGARAAAEIGVGGGGDGLGAGADFALQRPELHAALGKRRRGLVVAQIGQGAGELIGHVFHGRGFRTCAGKRRPLHAP